MAINKINNLMNKEFAIAQIKGRSLTEHYLSSLEKGRGLTMSETAQLSSLSQFYAQYQTKQLDTSEYLLNLKDYDIQISAEERDSIFIESLMADGNSVLSQAFGYSDKLSGYTAVHNYIDPFDSQVAALLNNLYQQGIIKAADSLDDQIKDMYNYVISNFDYVCEEKDDWNFAAETIAQGYGDCEDLAILTASLGMAIMINNGISYAEANQKFSVVAGRDVLYGDHVRVEYLAEDGNCYIVDAANASGGRIDRISRLATNNDNFEVYFRFNDNKVISPYEVKQDSFSQYLRADDPAAAELLQEVYNTGLLDGIDDYREAAAQIYHYICRNFDLVDNAQLLPDTGYTQAGKEGTQESLALLLSNTVLAFCQDKQQSFDKVAMAQIEKNDKTSTVVLVKDYTGAERVFDFSGMFSSGLADIRQVERSGGNFQEAMEQFFGYDNFERLSDLKKNGVRETRRHDLNNNLMKRTVKRFNPKAGVSAFSTYAAVVPMANPFSLDEKSMKELTDKSTYETHNIQGKLNSNSFINGSLLMGADTSTVGEKQGSVETNAVVNDTASGIALELSKKIKDDVKELFKYNQYIDSSSKANGFWSVDITKFEELRKSLLSKLRINNVLAMVKQADFEGFNLVYKELTGNDGYESMDVGKIYQKEMQTLDKAAAAVKKDMQDYVELRNQLRKTLVERANEWSMAEINKGIGIAALAAAGTILATTAIVVIAAMAAGSIAMASGVGYLAGLAIWLATAPAAKGVTAALAIAAGAEQLAMAISAAVAAGKQESLVADEHNAVEKNLQTEQKDLLQVQEQGSDPLSSSINAQYKALQEIVETGFDEVGSSRTQYSEKASIYKKEHEINTLQAVSTILIRIQESNLNSRALIHQEMTGVNGRKAAGIGSVNLSNEQEYIKSRLADVKAKRAQLVGVKTALSEANYNYNRKLLEAIAYGIAFGIGTGLEIAKALNATLPVGMASLMSYVSIPFVIEDMRMSFNTPMPEQLKAKDFLDKSTAPTEGFFDSKSGKANEKYNLYAVLDEAVQSGFVYVGSGSSKRKVVNNFGAANNWKLYGYGSIYRKNVIKAKEKFMAMANVIKANIMLQRYEKESRNLIHQEMTDSVPIQEMTDMATTMLDNEIAYLNSALAAIVSREETRVGIRNKKMDAINRYGSKMAGNVKPLKLIGTGLELAFMAMNPVHASKIKTDTFKSEMESITFKNPAYLPGAKNATQESMNFNEAGTEVSYDFSGAVYEISQQNYFPYYKKRAYFVDTEKIKKMTQSFLGLVTVIQCYASALGSWSAGRSNIHQEMTGKSSLRLSNVSQNILSAQSKQFMEYAGLMAKMADDYVKLCQKQAEGKEEIDIALNNLAATGIVFAAVLIITLAITPVSAFGNITEPFIYAETIAGSFYGVLESMLGLCKALADRFFAKYLEKEVSKRTKMDEKAKEYGKKTKEQGKEKEEAADESKSGSDSLFGQMVSGMLYKSHMQNLQKLKTALNETKKKNGESRSMIKGKISGVAGGYSGNAAAMISMLESSATTTMLDSMISAVRSADAQIKQTKAGANLVGAISSFAKSADRTIREGLDGTFKSKKNAIITGLSKGEKKSFINKLIDMVKEALGLTSEQEQALKGKLSGIKDPAEAKSIIKKFLEEIGLLDENDKEDKSDKNKKAKKALGKIGKFVKDFIKGVLGLKWGQVDGDKDKSTDNKNGKAGAGNTGTGTGSGTSEGGNAAGTAGTAGSGTGNGEGEKPREYSADEYAKIGAGISDSDINKKYWNEAFAVGEDSTHLERFGGNIWTSFELAGEHSKHARELDRGTGEGGGQEFLKGLWEGKTDEEIEQIKGTLGVKDLKQIKSVSQLSSLISNAKGQEGKAGENAKNFFSSGVGQSIDNAVSGQMSKINKARGMAFGRVMLGMLDFLRALLVDGFQTMERRGERTGSVYDDDPSIVSVGQQNVTVEQEAGTKITEETKTTPEQKGTLQVVAPETQKNVKTEKQSYTQGADNAAQGLNGKNADKTHMSGAIRALLNGGKVNIDSTSAAVGEYNLEFNQNRAVSDMVAYAINSGNEFSYEEMQQLGLGDYIQQSGEKGWQLNEQGLALQAAYQEGGKAMDSNDIRWQAANAFRKGEAAQKNLKIDSYFSVYEDPAQSVAARAEVENDLAAAGMSAEDINSKFLDESAGTVRSYEINYETTTKSSTETTVAHNFEYTAADGNKYNLRMDAASGETTITPQEGSPALSQEESDMVIAQAQKMAGTPVGSKADITLKEATTTKQYSYTNKNGETKTFDTEDKATAAMVEEGLSKEDKFTITGPDGKKVEGHITTKEEAAKKVLEEYGIDLDKMEFKANGVGKQIAVAGLAPVDKSAEFSHQVRIEDVHGNQVEDTDLQKEIAENDQEIIKGLSQGKYLRLKGKDGKVKYEKLQGDTPEAMKAQAMEMTKNLGEISGANGSVKMANWLRHKTGGEERGMVLESLIGNIIDMIVKIVEEEKERAIRQAEMDEKMALVLAMSRGSKNIKTALELLQVVNQEALESDKERNNAVNQIYNTAFNMTLDAAKFTASFIRDNKLDAAKAAQIKRIQGDIDNVDNMLNDKDTDVQAKVGDNNTVNITVKLPGGAVVEYTVTGVSPEEIVELINNKDKAFKEKLVSQARKYIEIEAQKAVADLEKTYRENAQSDEPDKKPKVHPFVYVGMGNAITAVLNEELAATKETSSDDKAPKDKMMADKNIDPCEPQTPASNAGETAGKTPSALKIEVKLVKNDQDSLQKANEIILASADIHAAGKTSKVPVVCKIEGGKEYVVIVNGEKEEKYLVDRSQSNENRVYLTPQSKDGKNDYSIIIEKDGNEVRFFKVKNGKKVRVEKGSKEYEKLNLAQLDGPVGLRVFEARSKHLALREEQMIGDIPAVYSIAPGSNPKEIDDFISSLPEGTYILKCGKTEVKVTKETDDAGNIVCKYYFPDSGEQDESGVLVARLKAQALGKPANEQAYISYVQTFDVSGLAPEQLENIAQLAQDSDRYSYDPVAKTLTITGEKLGTTGQDFMITVEEPGTTGQDGTNKVPKKVTEAEMLFGSIPLENIKKSEAKIQTSAKDTADAMRALALANTVKDSDFRDFASHYKNLQQIGANLQARTKEPFFQMSLGLFIDELGVDASGKPIFKGNIENLNLESYIENFQNSKSPKELKKLFKEMEENPAMKEILSKFKKNGKIDLEKFTEFLAIYQLRNLETLGLIPKGKAEKIIDAYLVGKYPRATVTTNQYYTPQLSPERQKSFQMWFQEKASLQLRLDVIAKHYRHLLDAFKGLPPEEASRIMLSMFLEEDGRDGQILQNLAQMVAQADKNRIDQIELYRKQILAHKQKEVAEAKRILAEVEKSSKDAKDSVTKAEEAVKAAAEKSREADNKKKEAAALKEKAEKSLAEAGNDQEKIKAAKEEIEKAKLAEIEAKGLEEDAKKLNENAKNLTEAAKNAKAEAEKKVKEPRVLQATEFLEEISKQTSWLPEGMQQGDFDLITRRYNHNDLMVNRITQVAQKVGYLKEKVRTEGLFSVSYESYWDMIFEANVKADADNFHQVARAEEQFADFCNRLAAAKSLPEKLAILSAENKLNATAQKYLLGLLQDGQINVNGKVYTIEYSNKGTYLDNDQKDDFIIIRDDQGNEVAKFSEDKHGVIVLTANGQDNKNNGLDLIALKETLNSTSMLAWDKICNGSRGIKFMSTNDAAAQKFRIETFFDHSRMKLERRINTQYPHKDYNVTKEQSQLQMLAIDQLQKNGYAILVDGYNSYARVEGCFGEGGNYTLLKFADGSYQLEIGNEKIKFRMEDLEKQNSEKLTDLLKLFGLDSKDNQVLLSNINQTSAKKILDAERADVFIKTIIGHNFDEAKINEALNVKNFKVDNGLVQYSVFMQNAAEKGWVTEKELQAAMQINGEQDFKALLDSLKEAEAIVQEGDKIIINSRYGVDQTLKQHQAEITDWDKLIKKAEGRQGDLGIHSSITKNSLVQDSKVTDQTFLKMAEKNGYLSVKEFKDSLEISQPENAKDAKKATAEEIIADLKAQGAILQDGETIILVDEKLIGTILEGKNAKIKGDFAALSKKALANQEKSKAKINNAAASSLKKQDELLGQWRAIYAKNQEREENNDNDIYYLELRSVGALTEEEEITVESLMEQKVTADVQKTAPKTISSQQSVADGTIQNPAISANQVTVHQMNYSKGSTIYAPDAGFAEISQDDKQYWRNILKQYFGSNGQGSFDLIAMASLTANEVSNWKTEDYNLPLMDSRAIYPLAITFAEMLINNEVKFTDEQLAELEKQYPNFMDTVKTHSDNLKKVPTEQQTEAKVNWLENEETKAALAFFAGLAQLNQTRYYTIGSNCVKGLAEKQNQWGKGLAVDKDTNLQIYGYIALPGKSQALPIVGFIDELPIIYYPNDKGDYGMRANFAQYLSEASSQDAEFTGDFEAKINIEGRGEVYISRKDGRYELTDPKNIFNDTQQSVIKKYLQEHSGVITGRQLQEACVFCEPSSFDYHSVDGIKTVRWSLHNNQPVLTISLNGQAVKYEDLPQLEKDLITKVIADRQVTQQEVATNKYSFNINLDQKTVGTYEVVYYPTGEFKIYQDGSDLSKSLSPQDYQSIHQAVAQILTDGQDVETKLQALISSKHQDITKQQLIVSLNIGGKPSKVLFDENGIPLQVDGRKVVAGEPGYQALLAVGQAARDGEIDNNELSLVASYAESIGVSSQVQTFNINVNGQQIQIVYDLQGQPLSVNGQKIDLDSELGQKLLAVYADLKAGNLNQDELALLISLITGCLAGVSQDQVSTTTSPTSAATTDNNNSSISEQRFQEAVQQVLSAIKHDSKQRAQARQKTLEQFKQEDALIEKRKIAAQEFAKTLLKDMVNKLQQVMATAKIDRAQAITQGLEIYSQLLAVKMAVAEDQAKKEQIEQALQELVTTFEQLGPEFMGEFQNKITLLNAAAKQSEFLIDSLQQFISTIKNDQNFTAAEKAICLGIEQAIQQNLTAAFKDPEVSLQDLGVETMAQFAQWCEDNSSVSEQEKQKILKNLVEDLLSASSQDLIAEGMQVTLDVQNSCLLVTAKNSATVTLPIKVEAGMLQLDTKKMATGINSVDEAIAQVKTSINANFVKSEIENLG